jgi:hypothetical protein
MELQVPPSEPKSTQGFPFEFELGRRMVQELGSSTKGSRDPMTLTNYNIPKSVEEVAIETMKVDRVAKLFQTMAIVSMNMGKLNLEVNIL